MELLWLALGIGLPHYAEHAISIPNETVSSTGFRAVREGTKLPADRVGPPRSCHHCGSPLLWGRQSLSCRGRSSGRSGVSLPATPMAGLQA